MSDYTSDSLSASTDTSSSSRFRQGAWGQSRDADDSAGPASNPSGSSGSSSNATSSREADGAPPRSAAAPRNEAAYAVTYKLDSADLGAFYKVAATRAETWMPLVLRSYMPVVMAFATVALVGLIFLLPAGAKANQSNPFFWSTLVLAVICLALLLQQVKRARAFSPLPNGAVLGQKSIELEPDGFMVTENGSQQACLWGNILEFVENETHLLMFVDNAAAHIIPKDAFMSPVEAKQFAAYCREQIYLAKTGS